MAGPANGQGALQTALQRSEIATIERFEEVALDGLLAGSEDRFRARALKYTTN